MRTPAVCITVVMLAGASSCTGDAGNPAALDLVTVPVFSGVDAGNFRAHAHGGEEVPAVDTDAQGNATFRLSKDGDAISYRLIVANIVDVTQSHIHLAPAGVNGGIVVWLYPSASPAQLIPGPSQGVLAEGVITEEDLVGGLAGMDLGALLDALRTGGAYVNVHTSANPSGEIRGQIH